VRPLSFAGYSSPTSSSASVFALWRISSTRRVREAAVAGCGRGSRYSICFAIGPTSGTCFFRGCYRTGLHEPLLERTLFDEVQSLLKERGEDAVVRPTVSDFSCPAESSAVAASTTTSGSRATAVGAGDSRYYMWPGTQQAWDAPVHRAERFGSPTRRCGSRRASPNLRRTAQPGAGADPLPAPSCGSTSRPIQSSSSRSKPSFGRRDRRSSAIWRHSTLGPTRGRVWRSPPRARCRTAELELRRDQLNSAIDEAPTDPYATVDIDAARKGHPARLETENEPAYAAERADLVRSSSTRSA